MHAVGVWALPEVPSQEVPMHGPWYAPRGGVVLHGLGVWYFTTPNMHFAHVHIYAGGEGGRPFSTRMHPDDVSSVFL